MEKRVIGIVLTALGVIGLIMGGYYFLRTSSDTYSLKLIATYGIIGLIFFVAGIGLIRNTSDKPS